MSAPVEADYEARDGVEVLAKVANTMLAIKSSEKGLFSSLLLVSSLIMRPSDEL